MCSLRCIPFVGSLEFFGCPEPLICWERPLSSAINGAPLLSVNLSGEGPMANLLVPPAHVMLVQTSAGGPAR